MSQNISVRTIEAGQQITEPGVYLVPIDRYHGDPDLFPGHSVSSTGLRLMADATQCPARYWSRSVHNPDRVPMKSTEPLRFGKGVHAFLLERDLPESEFAYHEFENWNTNEGHKGAYVDESDGTLYSSFREFKSQWKKAQEAAGKTIVGKKDIEVFKGMALALSKDPLIRDGLLEGLVEHTIVWQDPETGIWVKNRPDVIPSNNLHGDYKAVADASTAAISRSLGDYGYHQQLALTTEACARVLDRKIETTFLVAQEKTDIYLHNIAPISDDAIWWGLRQNRMALDRIKWCLDQGKWPGYSRWDREAGGFIEGPNNVGLPDYYRNRLLSQDEFEGLPDVKIDEIIGKSRVPSE